MSTKGQLKIYKDHPCCLELRLSLARHQIRMNELAEEACMSEGSVHQYCAGYRVPQLEVMDNLRSSLERLIARKPKNSVTKEFLEEIQTRKYMVQFKNDICELAVANNWNAWGLHDQELNEIGIILNREILIWAFLRSRRHRMSKPAARAKEALEATDLNDLPAIRAGLAHPKISIWEWTPDDWPTIHRILTHPVEKKAPTPAPKTNYEPDEFDL